MTKMTLSVPIVVLLLFTSALPLLAQPLSSLSVEHCKKYVGLREVRSNRSTQIDQWARNMGLPLSSQWCMCFQWNMEEDAARCGGWKNPLKKLGACFAQLRAANRIGSGLRVIKCGGIASHPIGQAGDLAIMSSKGVRVDLIGGQWTGHVKRIVEDRGDKFLCIGGNESNMVKWSTIGKGKILALIRMKMQR